MDKIEKIARLTFGYANGLRDSQRAAIEGVLAGKDVFVIAATGGGKSVCYQLPSLLVSGTVVVFSPLVALMKDQADKLAAWGIKSARLTSDMDDFYVRKTLRTIANIDVLYVAPERLKSSDFVRSLSESNIAFFAIDEAHCVSAWAQNFRPSFALIGPTIRKAFPRVPVMALTATADHLVEKDVAKSLRMREYLRVFSPPDRPNLQYVVVRDMEPEDIARHVASKFRDSNGSAIVYDTSRARVETMNALLRDRKVKSEAYHAGMDDDRRNAVQEAFMDGSVNVICATNAFGMGVDKANVRLVFHASVPRSITDYVQEAGRASRDGRPGTCVLNVTSRGVKSQRFFLRVSNPAYEVFEAVWNDVIARHPVGETFVLSTYDVRQAIYTCRVGSFDVPFLVESVLGYLEYRGLLSRRPDKTVKRFDIADRGRLFGVWKTAHPGRIRVKPGSNRVSVTILPGETDFTGRMIRERVVTEIDNAYPTVYYKARRKQKDMTITEEELDEKKEGDNDKFRSMLGFAESANKAAFIRAYFSAREGSPTR